MSLKSLLELVPPAAVYRRVPLAPERSALEPWSQAVEAFVKPSDEDDLWGELVNVSNDRGEGIPTATVDLAQEVLDQNAAALELLYEGITLERVQFPEFSTLETIPADSEFICRLGELARLPLVRFKLLAGDGDFPAAAEEIVRMLRAGEMICNGDGQMLHYLIGLWIRGAAVRAVSRLASDPHVPPTVLARLLETIQQSLKSPDGLAQSLRVDFCSMSLAQLDRAVEGPSLEAVVDRILEVYFLPRQRLVERTQGLAKAAENVWLSRRRQQMLALLEGHSRPFDKIATARLMGTMVAETIHDLHYAERSSFLGLGGKLRRLRHHFRHGRLARKTRFWPPDLSPGLPLDAGRADAAPSSGHRHGREKLRGVENPIGLVLVEHLLTFDYSPFMFEHRTRLRETQRILAKR